jgi:acetolactate synthase-1/2/3 large subunit
MQTGATRLIDALLAQAVDTVFCVPGESYLAAMDAMYEQREKIRLVVCRHEAAATFMAEAYGKVTGRPGVCFVTRAPGALHAAIGLHTAHQDSTPLILFIGQASRDFLEREAFQEVDYRRMFEPVTKWVAQVEDAERMPEMVSRAFHTALSGRRGPVVLALPEDVLSQPVTGVQRIAEAAVAAQSSPSRTQLDQMMLALRRSKKPLVVLGGSGWTQTAVDDMAGFLHATGLPVACSFRRQDLFDNRDPQYVGVLGLGADAVLHKAVRQADLLLLFGARMGEVPSGGYQLIDSPQPTQVLIHALPSPEELGRVYRPDISLLVSMPELAKSLAAVAPAPDLRERFLSVTQTLRQAYERHSTPELFATDDVAPMAGTLDQAQVWGLLRENLPHDIVITNGAGNYTAWAHRYFRYSQFGSQVAPTSGAMGYGLPAAIGAKLACPARPVLCLAGDGCFMMSAQELATAIALRLAIVIVVFDNQMFGTIRMHQEKHYPARVHGTGLENPDFVLFAQSFGAKAQRVESLGTLLEAVLEGFKASVPTLLHVRTNPELIGPDRSINSIRKDAVKANH